MGTCTNPGHYDAQSGAVAVLDELTRDPRLHVADETACSPFFDEDGITIYHGDCLDILPTLEQVDHVITDPPYSEQTHAGARTMAGGRITSGGEVGTLIDFASISVDQLRAAYSLAIPRRWFIATMDWRHVSAFEADPPDGLRFVRAGIWIKPDGAPQFTGDRPATGWEMIAVMHRDEGKMRWNGGGRHGVWTYNKCNTQHPTGKPLPLMRRLIEEFTDPGDTILDPFMGSGTTLRAAKDLGRKAIGIELNEDYCKIARDRMRQAVLL